MSHAGEETSSAMLARRKEFAGMFQAFRGAESGAEATAIQQPLAAAALPEKYRTVNRREYSEKGFGTGRADHPAKPNFGVAAFDLVNGITRQLLADRYQMLNHLEFVRSPQFEKEGKGRAHWRRVDSSILAGARIRGAADYGEFDGIAADEKNNLVSLEDFGATLYHALGIPPEIPPDPAKPAERLSYGRVVEELLG